MEIVILDKFTKTGKFLVVPEKGIYEQQKFEYGVVKNPTDDFQKIVSDYFSSKTDRKQIEGDYDFYTLKLFKGDGNVNEDYQEDNSYFNKEEIDDNIDDLYAMIEWSKKKNSWKISWKTDQGVWTDKNR